MKSSPIVDIIKPNTIAKRAFTIELPTKLQTAVTANMYNARYSGALNLSARSATNGPKIIKPTTAIVPAIYDPIAAIHKAAPAFPCLAIS